MNKLDNIFQTLGMDATNGLYYTNDIKWKTELQFPNRIAWLLGNSIKPDAFFCIDNKPLILFFENPVNKEKLHKDIWNFNETPIVIIIERGIIEIFNGFKLIESGDDKGFLEKMRSQELDDFSYFELVTGKIWETYHNELTYKNRVDYKLLTNIKDARRLIIDKFSKTEDNEVKKSHTKIANALLGKVIFVRYLIDREVILNFEGQTASWTNDDFCKLLKNPKRTKDFFNNLADKETGFNGDLFSITENEYNMIPDKVYHILIRLLRSQDMGTGQFSLFDLYDFSIIPTEFISNVYESFVGVENQAKEGVYYTPLFLVDYILTKTVGEHITRNKSHNCKVLDPSCGSGVFLVETLRKLIEQYKEKNPKIFEKNKDKFKEDIKNIAIDNIFGIDKDESAIQVAIFSIYLTLLSEMNPPEIATFKFPNLINTNFFCDDFFNENAEFNSVLKDKNFNFIVGNPPWKGASLGEYGEIYIKERGKKEKVKNTKYPIAINNNEIVEGFVLRTSDFCQENTHIAFIARSTILYNQGYSKQKTEIEDNQNKFRQYWLEEFFIDRVFELAPVRFEVFERSNDPAVAPAVVLFYRYANGKPTDNNPIEHITLKPSRFFSLFKIFSINRHDIKMVQQNRLKKYDWLWKILVYGSYLDFNFIQRLKNTYPSISQVISDTSKFTVGTGIQYSINPTYDSSHLIGCDFLESTGLESFFINPDKIIPFNEARLHRLRGENLFKAPLLLIRKGPDLATLTAKCALSDRDLLFKDTLSCIKVNDKKDIDIIQNIAAMLTSDLCTYYAINTFAFIGIEREQMLNYDKYSLPYIKNVDFTNEVNTLTQSKQKIFIEKKKSFFINQNIKPIKQSISMTLNNINKKIYSNIHISEIEKSLLDYALNINLPLISNSGDNKNKKQNLFKPIGFKENLLKDYADLFIARFASNFEKIEKRFVVEIWHTKQIIGMFFMAIPESEYEQDIDWKDKQNDTSGLFQKIIRLGTEKITDKLFIQKDIRGFEKDYFYVFKPNEKRLWHKAIAYLDAEEFMDAILRAGKIGE